ncbi:hypothetical protein BaRGS_00008472, partial [Batillaria attramentaria]
CEHLPGLGFRRGSYKCVCKPGFYFPAEFPTEKRYYEGTVVEEQYERKRKGLDNNYDMAFECLRCAPGCDTCEDPSPCVLTLNWLQRSILLGVSGLIMCFILVLLWFTIHYRDVKVMKAASPVLMRVVLLGAFFLYCPLIVGYFEATVVTCCIQFWLREIGFSISYGALLLKTWRISVVFRVRSAQRIKISDGDLIKRLIVIVFVFSVYLTARTVAGTPRVVQESWSTNSARNAITGKAAMFVGHLCDWSVGQPCLWVISVIGRSGGVSVVSWRWLQLIDQPRFLLDEARNIGRSFITEVGRFLLCPHKVFAGSVGSSLGVDSEFEQVLGGLLIRPFLSPPSEKRRQIPLGESSTRKYAPQQSRKDVSGLKAYICSSDWWDHSAAIAEMLFLLWGVRLCIVVRKAPSEFNESRFISWAIYNEFLLSLFLNVSMIFLRDPFPTNPDLLYLVLFVHTQLTTTVTLAFLFGTKAYLVYKYRGKEHTTHGGGTTMLSRGSKYTMGTKPQSTLSNAVSSNGGFGEKGEDEECESFLEKDIQ